ncbi:MAG: cell division protein FtsZ [Blastocatellia bacterium]|nr:cell division protein FtsZ [Blastocatellia bacterium]
MLPKERTVKNMTSDSRQPGSGINIFIDDDPPITGARIKVIGIGGGGGNAVNRMIEAGIEGIEFLVANTDLQALKRSRAPIKIQLGSRLTKGLGAGANPHIGRDAALEDTEKIIEVLEGADMVFVTTGLGGGTGTGAAPIIASLATELNALTVAVVTKPFHFEGRRRMQQADLGLRELRECVDTVITIPNERLLHTVERNVSLADSFKVADDVLRQAVQGISDLITVPGLINLDFADVKAIMAGMGLALMGAGRASGEHRAMEATQQAISSPLLEEATIEGAKGVLINITGGPDLTLFEVNEASSIIREAADEDANIIFGAVIDETLRDEMKITVIATGFDKESADAGTHSASASMTSSPSRYTRTTGDDLQRPIVNPTRTDDLDVPTFIRKKAD